MMVTEYYATETDGYVGEFSSFDRRNVNLNAQKDRVMDVVEGMTSIAGSFIAIIIKLN
jgi:hypothetical protein